MLPEPRFVSRTSSRTLCHSSGLDNNPIRPSSINPPFQFRSGSLLSRHHHGVSPPPPGPGIPSSPTSQFGRFYLLLYFLLSVRPKSRDFSFLSVTGPVTPFSVSVPVSLQSRKRFPRLLLPTSQDSVKFYPLLVSGRCVTTPKTTSGSSPPSPQSQNLFLSLPGPGISTVPEIVYTSPHPPLSSRNLSLPSVHNIISLPKLGRPSPPPSRTPQNDN